MTFSNRSSAFRTTYKAVQAVESIKILKAYKSFRVMRKDSKSSDDFNCYAVIHKSSMNFNDRVEVFECIHCDSLTLIEPCNCSLKH